LKRTPDFGRQGQIGSVFPVLCDQLLVSATKRNEARKKRKKTGVVPIRTRSNLRNYVGSRKFKLK